jgi:hypothetical protein
MSENSSPPDVLGLASARMTLQERFFPLHTPADVDAFLGVWPWAAIFKAGTSQKTFDAWFVVQRALESRVDVAVGFSLIPDDRPASDHVAARTGIAHRSPQFILFHRGEVRGHLDEFAIAPDQLVPLLAEHLPADVGPRVQNPDVVTLDPYRRMLAEYVDGTLADERFQWRYLERLAKESAWRDEETFAVLNGLFQNPDGRVVHPARLIALEFQAHLAGSREPLRERARRVLQQIDDRS